MFKQQQTFHLVDVSPYPIMLSLGIGLLTVGVIDWMKEGSLISVKASVIGVITFIILWLRDIIREGTYEGHHTVKVKEGLKYGMILFVVQEVMFFSGFFFAYYWLSIGTQIEIGGINPGVGVSKVEGLGIPALNTIILLVQGVSITYGHNGILVGNREVALEGLIITILLAVLFTSLQVYEYVTAVVSINDQMYGQSFYLLTGFHGFHVAIGTIMILVSLNRIQRYEGSNKHHLGFESAAIYWHFVDVVWLLLYVSIYVWT